jgi:hypothetical protein
VVATQLREVGVDYLAKAVKLRVHSGLSPLPSLPDLLDHSDPSWRPQRTAGQARRAKSGSG